jgi:hypothetical protein
VTPVIQKMRTDRLTPEEWIALDEAAVRGFISNAPVTALLSKYNTFSTDGMAKMVLEHETMEDVDKAVVDMQNVAENEPKFVLHSLPLPVTHVDFRGNKPHKSETEESRMNSAYSAGQEIGLEIERLTLGVDEPFRMPNCDAAVYGLCNFPPARRATVRPEHLVEDVTAALKVAWEEKFYGPWAFVHGESFGLTEHMRQQLLGIGFDTEDGKYKPIVEDGIVCSPQMRGLSSVLVQLTPDVVRIVVGHELVTYSNLTEFMAACVIVPQIRADYYGRCGVIVGAV